MAEKTKRRKRRRGEWKARDFIAVLELPERLAEVLRLLLHLDKATWDFALARIRQGEAYREWAQPKGPGKGVRRFAAPCAELKVVQRAILDRFLRQISVHFCRHGNQLGSSIVTNAAHHAGFAKAVFSVDLIHAFPSVFRSRVRANLRGPLVHHLRQFAGTSFTEAPEELRSKLDKKKADRDSVLTELLRFDVDAMLEALVDLLVLHDRLPQGPPTSPRILDIVCMKLDKDVWELLAKGSTPLQRFRYTAWADDLTISSDDEIPEELRTAILDRIRLNGFIPHTREDKTKYFSRATGEVPVITGIAIHEDGRMTMVPRKVKQLRARLHYYLGILEWDEEARGVLAGTLGYIRQLYPRKVPSTMRKEVERVEARLGIERPAEPVAVEAPAAAPSQDGGNGHAEPPKAKRARKRAGGAKGGKKSGGRATETLEAPEAVP
jgi:hypothetical protein